VADRSARARRAPRNQTAGRGSGKRDAAARPWWKRWWVALLVVPALLVAAAGLLLFFLVFSRVPLPDDIAATASIVYDRNGDEVGGLAAEVARDDVTLDELPEHVPQAVMGVEDRDFYEHRGISTTGIARALFTNVRSGSVRQGGSTITQQYIKNAAVGAEQTYTRKVQEAALAIKLEREFSKDEILGFYLNTIYWGRGAYGIQAAAKTYFDVDARDLTLNQAATLAGMIASPSNLDPAENPERVDGRRQVALAGMLEQGWIDQADHDAAVAEGVPDVTDRTGVELGPNAYYLDAVRRELSRVEEFDEGELFRGLRIHTHLEPRMQSSAQRVLADAVAEGPTDTGSIVTVDPATGGVLALVGGPDIAEQQLNAAVVSPRQPGSSFKAFTLQAFTEAGYSPESTLPAPAELEVEVDQGSDEYTVNNYGGSDYGEQTVYQATATSTNTVYFQMQEEAGRDRVIDAATRAGLPVSKSDEQHRTQRGDGDTMAPNPSLTLGVDTFTPLEMASAFATYAAEGLHVDAHLVVRVENADGRVLWEPSLDENQSVDVNDARVVSDALRRVVEGGTGQAAQIGRPAAGKTGTTNDSRDTWFVGYVPQLATSVWLGNLDNSPIEGDATGGGLAAPVWGEYMAEAVDGLEVEDFVRPDLSDLEVLNEEPAVCPSGYEFADPPSEADEDGFFPDILTDITDDQGRPCVEIKPEPEEEEPECPEGYAFADPPASDADPMPDVITDITDADGRPCVETDPEPTEEEEPEEEPEEEETEEPLPDLPGDGDDDGDDPGNGNGGGGNGNGGGNGGDDDEADGEAAGAATEQDADDGGA
jgi:penicillin-binding protein 1A